MSQKLCMFYTDLAQDFQARNRSGFKLNNAHTLTQMPRTDLVDGFVTQVTKHDTRETTLTQGHAFA
jgi:hypothetical protein